MAVCIYLPYHHASFALFLHVPLPSRYFTRRCGLYPCQSMRMMLTATQALVALRHKPAEQSLSCGSTTRAHASFPSSPHCTARILDLQTVFQPTGALPLSVTPPKDPALATQPESPSGALPAALSPPHHGDHDRSPASGDSRLAYALTLWRAHALALEKETIRLKAQLDAERRERVIQNSGEAFHSSGVCFFAELSRGRLTNQCRRGRRGHARALACGYCGSSHFHYPETACAIHISRKPCGAALKHNREQEKIQEKAKHTSGFIIFVVLSQSVLCTDVSGFGSKLAKRK